MAKKPRPYSMHHTARANPRRYLLSGIPPTLWEHARAKAKRDGVSMRTLLLTMLEQWLREQALYDFVKDRLAAQGSAASPPPGTRQ